ncbi:IPT/TIG domain-containing protein [bacterium]|nr:IPT/TIG domain-containing protein [bacterium]
MIKRVMQHLVLLAVLVAVAAACGGQRLDLDAPTDGGTRLAGPQIISVGAKTTSGAPVGVRVTWNRDTTGHCTGYYLYRYTDENRPPEPGVDTVPPFPIELRANGGSPIPQPSEGTSVMFDDVFPAIVGETYFYRLTALNDDTPPTEGLPGNELSIQIHGQSVSGLNPTAAYWGEDVTLTGDTFGTYSETSDFVTFPDLDGGSIAGAIVSWTETEIVVTVPEDSVTGYVSVVIESTVSLSPDELTILNPIITSIDPERGFVEQPLTVDGYGFGAAQGDSTVIIGSTDVTSAVSTWGETEIVLTVPAEISRGSVRLIIDGHPSNRVLFIARPEILDLSTTSAQAGEPLTLTGRHFASPAGQVLLDDVEELALTGWDADTISVTVAGTPGEHTLTVVTNEELDSNILDFTIVASLAVTLGGLTPDYVYTLADLPQLTVTAPADADRVELYVDDVLMGEPSTTAPFDDLEIALATLVNGPHDVQLKAFRRAIEAESEVVTINAYSLVGDINGDGVVDELDRDALVPLLFIDYAHEDYRRWQDTDDDGLVSEADLSAVGYFWGQTIQE